MSCDLRTVDPSIDKELANFPIYGFFPEFLIPLTRVQDRPWVRLGSVNANMVAAADFFSKAGFYSFLATGCYVISRFGTFILE